MIFAEPWWLAGGVAACAALWLLWRFADARRDAALARFIAAHLRADLTGSISAARRRTQRILFVLAVALSFAALAGPQYGFRWEQVSRRGNEIVFAIDTSRSMSTPDIKPNRLGRAKLAIDDFVGQLDGDGVGIVAFAGTAFLVCPITLDYGAFHEALAAVDTNTIPRGGTNISSAIHEADAALRRRPGSDKILILVTDGEDLEGNAVTAAETAKKEDGLRIYTVGVGTPGGDLIPIPPEQGGGFVKDEAGEFVKSHLDETALKAIAAATGGFYVPLGTQGEGLDTIYKSVLGPLAKHDLALRQQKIFTERFQWPLAAALASLLASLLIGTRRRVSATGRAAPASAAAAAQTVSPTNGAGRVPASAVAALALGSALAGVQCGRAHAGTLNAQSDYDKGNYAAAVQDYAAAVKHDPTKPTLHYNLGTAAYRAGQYPQAAQAFQQAIAALPSSDPKRLAEQEDAYYDLGNALYRAGQKSEQSAPQDTVKKWTDAVKAYETALQLRPDDADSKYNRDLVKRKLDALKQQQQRPPPQQPQSKNQNQNGQNQGQHDKENPGQSAPQSAGGNEPKPGQPSPNNPPPTPPPAANGSPGNSPPPDAGQQPPAHAGGPPQGQNAPGGNPQRRSDPDAEASDDQHLPGQMSREEARELLDSVKSDERRAPLTPMARRDAEAEQQPPLKNW